MVIKYLNNKPLITHLLLFTAFICSRVVIEYLIWKRNAYSSPCCCCFRWQPCPRTGCEAVQCLTGRSFPRTGWSKPLSRAITSRTTASLCSEASGWTWTTKISGASRLSFSKMLPMRPARRRKSTTTASAKPSAEEGATSVIVVYMEGDTTLTNLRKMFTSK